MYDSVPQVVSHWMDTNLSLLYLAMAMVHTQASAFPDCYITFDASCIFQYSIGFAEWNTSVFFTHMSSSGDS
jgi:hypothetical protein